MAKLTFYPDTSGIIGLVGYSGQFPKLEVDVKREAGKAQPDPLALGKRLAQGLGVDWSEGVADRWTTAADCLMGRHRRK